ncbi:hypothetical protein [Achromobacter sp.]|uniref:GTP pyrophosphokinase n=1 Tax=Achromobacter sp. TaxID=134375 RepID=UPI002F9266E9
MSDRIDELLDRHARLTETIAPLVKTILVDANIPFLAVAGRTKSRKSVEQKCKVKNYSNPEEELTDLSGIRVIVYVESDVARAVSLIRSAFRVDEENSIDKDKLLSVREAGYRSVHLICDIGPDREALKEYSGLAALKFEIQVRTVLQHAWAELEHDKNYKFQEGLPEDMQRQLYLHAGLLELADRGLDRLSQEIDQYAESLREKAEKGDLSSKIDAVSVVQFVERWAAEHGAHLEEISHPERMPDLLEELDAFGIETLSDLNGIIPPGYAEQFPGSERERSGSNVFSVVRDWLLIKDAPKLAGCNWIVLPEDIEWLANFLPARDMEYIIANFLMPEREDE